jgi:hypothetical protein
MEMSFQRPNIQSTTFVLLFGMEMYMDVSFTLKKVGLLG